MGDCYERMALEALRIKRALEALEGKGEALAGQETNPEAKPINLKRKQLETIKEEEGVALVDIDSEVYWWHKKYRPRKPKYVNRVYTGYEWNKYNRTHYDDRYNPSPKMVQGYKFDIFYPDLVDNSKAPTYTIDRDGNSSETCIIRFHVGAPYEDIAFRIVNKEWEYSKSKGFKCTFHGGILQVHFNFKRYHYRR